MTKPSQTATSHKARVWEQYVVMQLPDVTPAEAVPEVQKPLPRAASVAPLLRAKRPVHPIRRLTETVWNVQLVKWAFIVMAIVGITQMFRSSPAKQASSETIETTLPRSLESPSNAVAVEQFDPMDPAISRSLRRIALERPSLHDPRRNAETSSAVQTRSHSNLY